MKVVVEGHELKVLVQNRKSGLQTFTEKVDKENEKGHNIEKVENFNYIH